jgi:hypothetical protein
MRWRGLPPLLAALSTKHRTGLRASAPTGQWIGMQISARMNRCSMDGWWLRRTRRARPVRLVRARCGRPPARSHSEEAGATSCICLSITAADEVAVDLDAACPQRDHVWEGDDWLLDAHGGQATKATLSARTTETSRIWWVLLRMPHRTMGPHSTATPHFSSGDRQVVGHRSTGNPRIGFLCDHSK